MGFFRDFASKHGLGAGKASMKHVSAGAEMIREVGEGAITGAALGAAHAMLPLGLDIDGKAPLDAGIALVGIVGGVMLAHEEGVSQTLRNVGAAASTVFSFRKMYEFAAYKKMNDTTKAPQLRIPGDRVQEQNVLVARQQKANALAVANPAAATHAGEFGFGADVGAEDPIVTASRSL